MLPKFKLLQTVALVRDLPEFGLRAGTRGTIIEEFTAPNEAYEVEFVGTDGRPFAQVALEPELIMAANIE